MAQFGFLSWALNEFLYDINISAMCSKIVQYVLVRGDLLSKLEWPVGAVIAQACHACSAVLHLYYQDECTQKYFNDLDNMHKIVLEVELCNTLIIWQYDV